MSSASGTVAKKWTCHRCEMSVSRLDGSQASLPENWASAGEGYFCLACRRERAAEAAVDAAPSDCDRNALVKLRRAGLIEFELRRAPDRADRTIAQACSTSVPAVAEARRRLQQA